jgi:hypothetical protein
MLSRKSESRITTLREQDEWHCMEEVRNASFPRVHRPSHSDTDMLPAVFGPAATTWFKFLQNRVRLPNKNAEIIARVFVDQTVFSTTNLFCFLSSMAIMEGTDPKEKLEKSYKTALIKNWTVWPFIQLINFKMVPLHHRVLVVNVVSLGMDSWTETVEAKANLMCTGWNCYLSYINSQ